MNAPIVIIGAGQAGLQTAEALRSEGHEGPVLMLGDEAQAPYHRPPLSKAYLLGEFAESQLTIRSPQALEKKRIEFRPGVAVRAIDRTARRLQLADGSEIAYAGLCIATGARARDLPVPGAQAPNVLPLRTLADTRAVAAELETARTVVVIGGGFIGLEFAAVANKLGKTVTVLEAAPRLMARAVTPALSDFYRDLHRAHGVAIELGAQVERLAQHAGRVKAVLTTDGRAFAADLVIVGIGVLANGELAQAAGLECERGAIVVDACARTSDAAIVAAGDCAVRRLPDGSLLRLESVQNAVEQGKSAAAALLGRERPFTAAPWFWSDQYDVKLQMAGLAVDVDHTVLRGDVQARKFSAFHYRAGRLIAVDSINRAQDHLPARKLLDRSLTPTPEQAADLDFPLERLLA